MGSSTQQERDKVLSEMHERYRSTDADLQKEQEEAKAEGDVDKYKNVGATRDQKYDEYRAEREQVWNEYKDKEEEAEAEADNESEK